MTTELEYKRLFENLLEEVKSEGYIVTYKDEEDLLDYEGMNKPAADAMSYDRPIKNNELQLLRGMTWEKKYKTLWHERYEEPRVRKTGKYFPNHRKSLAEESKL